MSRCFLIWQAKEVQNEYSMDGNAFIIFCCSVISWGMLKYLNHVFMEVGKDTFDFVLPLLCVTAFWNGILYIAKDAGIYCL